MIYYKSNIFADEQPVYNFTTRLFSFIELQCNRTDKGFDTDISEEIFGIYNDVSLDFEDTSRHKGVVTTTASLSLTNEIFVKAGECGVVISTRLTSKSKIGSEVCLVDIGDECTTFRFLSGFSGIGSLFAGDFLLAASPSVD